MAVSDISDPRQHQEKKKNVAAFGLVEAPSKRTTRNTTAWHVTSHHQPAQKETHDRHDNELPTFGFRDARQSQICYCNIACIITDYVISYQVKKPSLLVRVPCPSKSHQPNRHRGIPLISTLVSFNSSLQTPRDCRPLLPHFLSNKKCDNTTYEYEYPCF